MARNWLFDPSIRVRTCIESRIRAESHGNERDSARTSYSPFSCRLYRISSLSRSRNRYARTSGGRGSLRRSTHSKSIRWTRDTRARTRQLWRKRSGSGDRSVRAYQRATNKKEIIQHLEELDRNLHPRTVTGARISYSVGEKVRGPV